MVTVVNFLAALVVSWVIVYAAYGLTRAVVRSVWWMVHSAMRLGEAARNIRSWRADGITATLHSTAGRGAKSAPAAKTQQPAFPDVAISVKEASEALLAYERRVFWARSEIRKTAARTRETIAQTRALLAEVDAPSRRVVRGPAS